MLAFSSVFLFCGKHSHFLKTAANAVRIARRRISCIRKNRFGSKRFLFQALSATECKLKKFGSVNSRNSSLFIIFPNHRFVKFFTASFICKILHTSFLHPHICDINGKKAQILQYFSIFFSKSYCVPENFVI